MEEPGSLYANFYDLNTNNYEKITDRLKIYPFETNKEKEENEKA